MRPDAILCDIEGTTSSLSFVHDVLFPLSIDRMETFLATNWDKDSIRSELDALSREMTGAFHTSSELSEILRAWIRENRKHTVLKSIQGKIWKVAFESGEIRGHVYADVPDNFLKWKRMNIKIAIFSSGSVEAQQLLFKYSDKGDLSSYISAYFDTATGEKKKAPSYEKIAQSLSLQPAQVLFLSDSSDELDAARDADMRTIQTLREGIIGNNSGHTIIESFDQLEFE